MGHPEGGTYCGTESVSCKLEGESCSVASECCEAFCGPDGTGANVCGGGGCVPLDQRCSTSSDCCDPGALCFDLGAGPVCFPDLGG